MKADDEAADEGALGTDYRALFELAGDAIMIFEPESEVVLEANACACELHGMSREEFIGSSLIDVTEDVARGREEVRKVLETGSASGYQTTHVAKDGSDVHLEGNAVLIDYHGRPAILGIARDVSERKRLERELVQAQKMEAIGQLAGGIAHDFSNLLTAIMGSAAMMRGLEDLPIEGAECVEDILASAEHGCRLTKELLAFSRRQETQPQLLDINRTVENVARWLSRLLEDHIVLELELANDIGAVHVDPVQIEQVVLNLAVNARDAMPDGGTLTIETRNIDLGETWVCLSVRDTGVGMDKATMANVFTPFFTTKPIGKGTGLGLATVYGIVKQSGGKVHIDSVVGMGTTVDVFLPLHAVDAQSIPPPPPLIVKPGDESILVVEDDAGVRSTVRRILRSAGYEVVVAADATEALRLYEQSAGAIGAVISDVQMPGPSGVELAVSLRQIRPDLPIVLMSGHHDAASLGDYADVAFLAKPFKPSELTHVLRRALDGA